MLPWRAGAHQPRDVRSHTVSTSCWASMPEADFRCLQEEVSQYVKKAQLLEKVGDVVFSSILAMLGDREALQGLEDKVRGSHGT